MAAQTAELDAARTVVREMISDGRFGQIILPDGIITAQLFRCSSLEGALSVIAFDEDTYEVDYQYHAAETLGAISGIVERTRAELFAAGYPEWLFAPYLDEFALSHLSMNQWDIHAPSSQQYQSLLIVLNEYRANLAPNLPSVKMGSNCGDGFFPVVIHTVPEGGRIWMLSEFGFKLCSLLGKDVYDLRSNDCEWTEIGDRSLVPVSGNYRIVVDWPDGERTFSRRSFFDPINEFHDGGPPIAFDARGSLPDDDRSEVVLRRQ